MKARKPIIIAPGYFGKTPPPNNLDAEGSVLNEILERHSVDGVSHILKPEHFYSDANRRIYEAALDLAEESLPIDLTTVQEWLRARGTLQASGGEQYLRNLLLYIPTVGHVEQHAKILVGLWKRREIIVRCLTAAAEAHVDPEDDDKLVERVESSICQLNDSTSQTTIEQVAAPIRRVFAKIHQAAERNCAITGTSTGFAKLDEMTSGLHSGDLTIVAARPGMGKTSFVMNMAVNVAAWRGDNGQTKGDGVAVFSLEMPREQLMSRMSCSEGRVDLGRMRQNKLQPDDWTKLTEATKYLSTLPIYIDDASGMTLLELRSKTRRAQSMAKAAGTKLGLVVIDYLQLMSGQSDNREQEIAGLSRGLKRFAKDMDVPVIALSQLNRAVETRSTKEHKPQLSDLRESGAIEQDADNVLFIYRDDYYHNRDDSDKEKKVAEIIISKQRNGPTGSVFLKFTNSYTRFEDLPYADYPEYY